MATMGAALAAEAVAIFAITGVFTAWVRARLTRTAPVAIEQPAE